MIKVMSVFGTRPEAIKMAPVVKELEKHSDQIKSIVCVTAQHRQMLDMVLEAFDITPDYDLNVMQPNQTLSMITAKVIEGMESIIEKEKPDIVLVHGDTTTAMAAAMAAFYQQVPIGHVEAGLRTFDKYSPFPEEINRQIIDCMADMLFAPTELSRQNLGSVRNRRQEVYVTGNTAIDALATTVSENYSNPVLEWVTDNKLILITAHRRENLGDPMRSIFRAIKRIIDETPNVKAIYPVHLNPKVQEVAKEVFGDDDKIKLIDPLEVVDFHNFMGRSYIILTDSGGIQEEAPSLGKPVLVLRDTTERPEGIESGTLKLVGTNEDTVYEETRKLLEDEAYYLTMSKAENPYGDGKASERIVQAILDKFNK